MRERRGDGEHVRVRRKVGRKNLGYAEGGGEVSESRVAVGGGTVGNCVGQKNGPSRQLEVPENGFGKVIEPICSSAGGIRLALGCL